MSLAATADSQAGRALGADLLGALALLPVPAAVISRNGKLVWQNRIAEQVYGDTIGRTLTRYAAPESRADVVAAFVKVLEGTPVVVPVTGLDRGGGRVALTVAAAPLREQGRIAGALVIAFAGEQAPAVPGPLGETPSGLTPRQLETLRLLGEGRSTSEIAATLGVTHETARNHVRAMLRRLDVHSRLEAVAAGHRLGLL